MLRRGAALGAAEVGVLAAVGATSVTVSALPRVAVLSTGTVGTVQGRGGGARCCGHHLCDSVHPAACSCPVHRYSRYSPGPR